MKIIKQIIILLTVLTILHCRIHIQHLSTHKNHKPIPLADLQNATVEHTSTHFIINSASRVVTTLNVPDVFQATDYTCGPSSLTAVLNYFHIDQREADLAKLAKTNDENGTDPYDLLAAIHKLGIQAQMKENMTFIDVQNYITRGYPVIMLIQAWKDDDDPTPYPEDTQDGHYVVAIGYDNDYLYFEDPWIIGSLTYMKKSQINGRWHGDTLYPRVRIIYGCGIVVTQKSGNINPVIYLE